MKLAQENLMTTLVVLVGCVLEETRELLTIVALNGQVFGLPHAAVVKRATIETGKNPLTRFFVDPEANITLTVKAKDFVVGQSRVGGTIAKYLDDGGTISKSRDDGGGGGTPSKDFDDGGGTPSKDYDDGGGGSPDKSFDDGGLLRR
jgi:hypothetical protein